jgi:thiol-disulfide isomerase/thioredoxin
VRGGEDVTVGDGSEQVTMLVFFATWCPHCNDVAPIISELESQYDDLRVVMVSVDRRDDPAKVREFVDRYDIAGPAIYQPSPGSTYRVSGYPTTYVLDGEEGVVVGYSGEAPTEAYERRRRTRAESRRPSGQDANAPKDPCTRATNKGGH